MIKPTRADKKTRIELPTVKIAEFLRLPHPVFCIQTRFPLWSIHPYKITEKVIINSLFIAMMIQNVSELPDLLSSSPLVGQTENKKERIIKHDPNIISNIINRFPANFFLLRYIIAKH